MLQVVDLLMVKVWMLIQCSERFWRQQKIPKKIDFFFLLYLHHYCCVPIYKTLILLLLALNNKNNIYVITSSPKRRGHVILCLFGVALCVSRHRMLKTFWVREINLFNWYFKIIFYTCSQMSQCLTCV